MWLKAALLVAMVTGAFSVWVIATQRQVSVPATCLHGAFFVLASAAGMMSLARRLPLQNVTACALAVWATAFIVLTVGIRGQVIFGKLEYAADFRPWVLWKLPWVIPFIWLAMILASREAARVVLRPWRRNRNYGFGLLCVAAVLTMLLDLSIQPMASKVAGWWSWRSVPPAGHWQGVPWYVFLTGFLMGALLLGFAGPWLVVKRPAPHPPGLWAVAPWLVLAVYALAAQLAGSLWGAAVLTALGTIAVVTMAWRGTTETESSPSSAGVSTAVPG